MTCNRSYDAQSNSYIGATEMRKDGIAAGWWLNLTLNMRSGHMLRLKLRLNIRFEFDAGELKLLDGFGLAFL